LLILYAKLIKIGSFFAELFKIKRRGVF